LDGSLPGDYGFDPLGLYDMEASGGLLDRQWLSYSEVIHGRWAMLGAVGCIAPEILGQMHIIPAATAVEWFRTGWLPFIGAGEAAVADAVQASSSTAGGLYWADPQQLFLVQVLLMGFAEVARFRDYKDPGSMGGVLQPLVDVAGPEWEGAFEGSGAAAYPGGPVFNCLDIVESGPAVALFKEQEVKHGRLAMIAMMGYGAQAVMTGKGPWENLQEHLSNPLMHNICTNFGGVLGQSPGV
jgi:light-harvesting complex I chlorophyll a/b binding protein 3